MRQETNVENVTQTFQQWRICVRALLDPSTSGQYGGCGPVGQLRLISTGQLIARRNLLPVDCSN